MWAAPVRGRGARGVKGRAVRAGAGFSIAEIRTFLHGYPEGTPPSERWRRLAHEKLPEVEALIERALGTKRVLKRWLTCECERVEDCIPC